MQASKEQGFMQKKKKKERKGSSLHEQKHFKRWIERKLFGGGFLIMSLWTHSSDKETLQIKKLFKK